jgi:hypothetical protein
MILRPGCTHLACSVNELNTNQPIFCFLSRTVIGSMKDLLEVGVPRYSVGPSGSLESRSIKSTILSGLPEVGVPWSLSLSMHEYLSALQDDCQLCWSSGNQNSLPEVSVPWCLGPSIPSYLFSSANLAECPGCKTFLSSTCFYKPCHPVLGIPIAIG